MARLETERTASRSISINARRTSGRRTTLYAPRRCPSRQRNCSICLPVEVYLSVNIRSLCDRSRGGMVTEVAGQERQSFSLLQGITNKKQRNSLPALISPVLLGKDGQQDHDSEIGNNELCLQVGNPKRISRQERQENRKHRDRETDNENRKHREKYSNITTSDSDHLDVRDGNGYENNGKVETEKRKKRRLKGGTDDCGIPYNIKRAAMLKGAQMCRLRLSKIDIAKRRNKRVCHVKGVKSKSKISKNKRNLYFPHKRESKKFTKSGSNRSKIDDETLSDTNREESISFELISGSLKKFIEKTTSRIQTPMSFRLKGGMERSSMIKNEMTSKRNDCSKCRCDCLLCRKVRYNKAGKKNSTNFFHETVSSSMNKDTSHMEGYNINTITKRPNNETVSLSKFNIPKFHHTGFTPNMKNLCVKVSKIPSETSGEYFSIRNTNTHKLHTKEIETNKEIKSQHYTVQVTSKQQKNVYDLGNKKVITQKKLENHELVGEPNHCRLQEMWRIEKSSSKINNRISRKKSRSCACCLFRKPANTGRILAITRKSQLSADLINNLENNAEIDFYKNTVKKQSQLHKARTTTDPLETLRKVNEKLEELTSLAARPPGMDKNTLPLNHCTCQANCNKVKRRKTRRYYQKRYQEYGKCFSDTTADSNVLNSD